jgi:hypothetical protein
VEAILNGIASTLSAVVPTVSGSDDPARESEIATAGVMATGNTVDDARATAGGSTKKDVLACCRRTKGRALDAASWARGVFEAPLVAESKLEH